jgi:4-coumarate--CoA ligase
VKHTAERFGSFLRTNLSWREGEVAAIFSVNCIDTPAIIWGIHWAGGVVSPTNPSYTTSELVHHLKDCGAKLLVTQKGLLQMAMEAASIVGLSGSNILLIGDEMDLSDRVRHFSEILSDASGKRCVRLPKDLAFLVYSSGTTGLPKGVRLTHGNIVADLSMLETVEGRMLDWDRDRTLSVLPFYHIYGNLRPQYNFSAIANTHQDLCV